ncbi:MAG TPA: ferritin [Methanothrix sp.]|jgi:ferritin|nr:ferritin [Methanothrix sp.]HNT72637.1 ferritin [Methanothrix sp.]HPY73739.1 ferritin [Methanothrix sp.]HQA63425.1 ferritin [Methanothrix sp.]
MAAIGEKMARALNEQVRAELYSSYLYLAMSAHFSATNLPGFANWMRVQAQEELMHGMKIYDFVIARGGRAELLAIEKPPFEWASPLQVVEEVYSHEKKVTGLIHALVDLAAGEKDHATTNMLQWFVDEQVEEEANAREIVEKVRMAASGDEGIGALYILDRDLGMRPAKLGPVASGD